MAHAKRATLAAFVLAIQPTFAKPPPGADLNSPESKWVQTLKSEDTGISCCSLADCRKVDYRVIEDHYQAMVNDKWVDVPPNKVVKRENPTGSAWLCYNQSVNPLTSDMIFCFVGLDMF